MSFCRSLLYQICQEELFVEVDVVLKLHHHVPAMPTQTMATGGDASPEDAMVWAGFIAVYNISYECKDRCAVVVAFRGDAILERI